MPDQHHPRVLIIGLDGADWSLLRPLFDAGVMPALRSFVKDGASATLESVLPTNSMSAWTSFMTGVNPGKHGVYEFVRNTRTPFQTHITNSSAVRFPSIWETLSAAGRSSCVIDLPPCYPPFEIQGVMIGGMGAAADPTKPYGSPTDVVARVEAAVGGFQPDVTWVGRAGDEGAIVSELCSLVENRRRMTEELMRERDFDVVCSIFVGPDRLQHVLWRDLTEGGPHADVARSFYAALDEQLARIFEATDFSQTDVLVVSDHGFRWSEKTFDVNQFCVEQGLTTWKTLESVVSGTLRLVGKNVPMPKAAGKALVDVHTKFQRRVLAHSLAYSDTAEGVNINLAGRESTGQVPRERFDEVRDTIARALLEFRDPANGRAVIRDVVKGESYFHGEHADEAPDLVLQFNDGYAYSNRMGQVLFEWPFCQGVHSTHGIIAARGPAFRHAIEAEPVGIMDVAPTIYGLLGVSAPSALDGRMLETLLAEGAVHPPDVQPVAVPERRAQPDAYSDEEEERVRERLRGLGYID
jgi:predicted AlkP superfamily phosphohydrolase/phosphomutase